MKTAIAFFLLFGLLVGNCYSGEKFDQFLESFAWEANGYDALCVKAIKEMVRGGEISEARGKYLISQTCKKPEPPQFHGQQPSMNCPICGLIGNPRSGLNGLYYVCPRGHAWR